MGNTIGTNVDLLKKHEKVEFVTIEESEVALYEIVDAIVTSLSNNGIVLTDLSKEDLHVQVERAARKLGYNMTDDLTNLVRAHAVGYGILDQFVTNPENNNVFVNKHNDIWIQKGHKRMKVDADFGSVDNLQSFIRILQAKLGGEINADNARATFYDSERNLRIVCVIEPVALNGPSIVIRIHRGDNNFTVNDLVELNTLSKEQAMYLIMQLKLNRNVYITGIGASGKTTVMRALLDSLEPERRIMTMEEDAELHLKKSNVLAYLVKRNERGQVVGMREFLDVGIKSSIDTFVFGENSGEEAFVLISAGYSGHQIVSTLHTKTLEDVPERLAINMLMSGTKVDFNILVKMVLKTVDVIVLMDKFKIKEIGEVKDGEISPVSFNHDKPEYINHNAVV